jgi:L-serine dehydratase
MIDIFDILGPIMVGPSSSHTAGAVRIGITARTLLGENPVQAKIGLYGSFAETGFGHGTDMALVAGLLGMKPDDLRIPDSISIARKSGLSTQFYTAHLKKAHPNTAVLDLIGESGKRLVLQASSTGGGRICIDKFNGVDVSFTASSNTLVILHNDVEGVIAEVTKVLTDSKINIATMNVCRNHRGGSAIMIIETDQSVDLYTRSNIEMLPGVTETVYFEKEDD